MDLLASRRLSPGVQYKQNCFRQAMSWSSSHSGKQIWVIQAPDYRILVPARDHVRAWASLLPLLSVAAASHSLITSMVPLQTMHLECTGELLYEVVVPEVWRLPQRGLSDRRAPGAPPLSDILQTSGHVVRSILSTPLTRVSSFCHTQCVKRYNPYQHQLLWDTHDQVYHR